MPRSWCRSASSCRARWWSAVLSIFYGARHWPAIVLVAIGVPGIVYVVFRRVLAVALPELPDF